MPGAGDYLKGAGGGAMAGGAIGGPWGAAIGAGVGLLGTAFAGDPNDQQAQAVQQYLKYYQNRDAPQMGAASQSDMSAYRAQQQGLANRLDAQSRGAGPSLATEQLKAGLDQNMSQQASIAAGGTGNQAGVAAFMAANNAARAGTQTNQLAAQARIQEQYNAQQQLAGVLNQGRNSDEANTQFNAQQNNYAAEANLKAKLEAMGYNDAQIRALLGVQTQDNNAPKFSDQMLAGGAGMYAQAATQNAQAKASSAKAPAGNDGYNGVRMPDGSLYGGH